MLWQILHQLKSKDPAVRRKAVEQLCQAPNERAARVLAAVLNDSDAEVRRLAAVALGKLEDEGRFVPLLEGLRDRDAGLVQAAIAALKKGEPDQVVPRLEPLLRHADAGVRGQAAQTLESLGWRPSEREEEIWYRVAKGQFFQAAGFGLAALPALESALTSCPAGMGPRLIEALGHVGDPRVVRPLVQALKSSEPSLCIAAITALSRMDANEATSSFLGLLKHRNAQVRAAATEAVGRLRARDAVEQLCDLLRDPVWEVRREAAEALGRLGDRGALDALTKALADSDADVREATAIALGSLGDARAVGPLVLALRDPTSGVRRIAAATLSRLDTDWSSLPEARAAAEELKPALQDNDPGVRHFVSHLLAAMNAVAPGCAPLASPTPEFVAEQRRKLAVSCFSRILCDTDRDLRHAAAIALVRLGGEGAPAALVRARADHDQGVRDAVEQALRAIGA
jgi:HEAT repeat protein